LAAPQRDYAKFFGQSGLQLVEGLQWATLKSGAA
jgi:hypothetical protein